MSRAGLLLVMTGPSGCGKTTLVRRAMGRLPELRFSISYTTRPAREGEVDGKDYFFVEEEAFLARAGAGEFLEWAVVHGNHYGTQREQVAGLVADGAVVLLDIDVQGARQVRESGVDAVFLFILPPSLEALEARLKGRDTDSKDVVDGRLAVARSEMAEAPTFDYLVVNDVLEEAEDDLLSVIRSERLRRSAEDTCMRLGLHLP